MDGTTNQNNPLLASKRNEVDATVRHSVHERVNRAIDAGRFLVVSYRLDGRELKMDLDMRDFPHADFAEVLRMFRESLSQELKRVASRSQESIAITP